MSKNEIFTKINSIFRDVFDDKTIMVSESTSAADIKDWDSLSHIILISAIEDEFGIRFNMKDILNMKNVGEMADILAEMTGKHIS